MHKFGTKKMHNALNLSYGHVTEHFLLHII